MGVAAVCTLGVRNCFGAPGTELAGRRGPLSMRCSRVRPGSLSDGGFPRRGSPAPRLLGAGLPGHAWGLQSWYSAALPTQGRPPSRGSGFVHVLLRTRKPSSQSREQDDHGPQGAQPPLTVCGAVPPLRRRSSTRAGCGDTGLSDKGFFQTRPPTRSHSRPCSISLNRGGTVAGEER